MKNPELRKPSAPVFRSAQTSLRPRTDYLRRSPTAHYAIAVGELIPFLCKTAPRRRCA
ncbi:MAG: hypothetical protein ACYTXA_29100 [Nostoc sp.]